MHRGEIDLEHRPPLRLRVLVESGCGRPQSPGAVHRHVQPAPVMGHGGGHRTPPRLGGHIGGHGGDPGVGEGEFLETGGVPGHCHHLRSRPGIGHRQGVPDPG